MSFFQPMQKPAPLELLKKSVSDSVGYMSQVVTGWATIPGPAHHLTEFGYTVVPYNPSLLKKWLNRILVFKQSNKYFFGCCVLGVGVGLWVAYKMRIFKSLSESVSDKFCKWKENLYSWALDVTCVRPRLKVGLVRSTFRDMSLPHISDKNPGHTHPKSAAWRSSSATVARQLGGSLGLTPFMLQASGTDAKHNLQHYRSYHWAKDTMVSASSAEAGPDHLLTIVDVDYYLDVPKLLIDSDGPVLLYTFQPTTVAQATGEFVFYFNDKNEVCYRVAGGAHYCHKVWRYSRDVITVTIGWTTKYFIVERRKANPHHEHVCLIPIGTWRGLFSCLASYLSVDNLDTYSINFGKYNVLDNHDGGRVVRSIGRVGNYVSAEVDAATVESLCTVSRTSALQLQISYVQSWISTAGVDGRAVSLEEKQTAAVLVEYIRESGGTAVPITVYAAADSVRSYQLVNKISDVDLNPKVLMVPFMSPLLPEAYVPTAGKSNEEAAVDGRIILPKADAAALSAGPVSQFLLTCMHEFIELTYPGLKNTLSPVDANTVYERQGRPSQRAILQRAEGAFPNRVASTFLKREAYQKCSDPRIITQANGVDKLEYSTIIYAVSDVMVNLGWYGPGKTPLQLADQVVTICSAGLAVHSVDFHRMDGHKVEKTRLLERLILLYLFKPEYHNWVIEQHSATYNLKAYTPNGVKYDMGFAQGSGIADTACFNTTTNKFSDYTGRRYSGISKEEAYNTPGTFTGDDSLVRAFSNSFSGGDEIVKANAMVGQRAEIITYLVGSEGVSYLARVFTDEVWTGSNVSYCDLARTLSKLHVTVALNQFTPLEKLTQKLMSLALTDANTPIIDKVIKTAVRLGLDFSVKPDSRIVSWWSNFGLDQNWPNGVCKDSKYFLEKAIPGCEVSGLYKYLDDCKRPEDLLKMPFVKEMEPSKPNPDRISVVDNQIFVPVATKPKDMDSKVFDQIVKNAYIVGNTPSGSSPKCGPDSSWQEIKSVYEPKLPSAPVVPLINPFASLSLDSASSGDLVTGKPDFSAPKHNNCKQFVMSSCDGKTCGKTHARVCKDYALKTCSRHKCKFPHTFKF